MNKIKFKGNEKGFSLPEVLISLAIFAVVGVTFVSALGTNFKVLLMADQRTTAESLAKAQLEAINNAAYNSTYDNITVSRPTGYYINIVVDNITVETGAHSASDTGVQKITVSVTCQQRSPPNAPVIVIGSYKRKL